jgi:hypothetical protein
MGGDTAGIYVEELRKTTKKKPVTIVGNSRQLSLNMILPASLRHIVWSYLKVKGTATWL